jgi:hypothetical protein
LNEDTREELINILIDLQNTKERIRTLHIKINDPEIRQLFQIVKLTIENLEDILDYVDNLETKSTLELMISPISTKGGT